MNLNIVHAHSISLHVNGQELGNVQYTSTANQFTARVISLWRGANGWTEPVPNAPQLLNTEGNFDHTTKDISEAQRIRCPSVQCESRNTLTLRLSNHPQCSHIVATPSPRSSPDQRSWSGLPQCDLLYNNLSVWVCVCVCVCCVCVGVCGCGVCLCVGVVWVCVLCAHVCASVWGM